MSAAVLVITNSRHISFSLCWHIQTTVQSTCVLGMMSHSCFFFMENYPIQHQYKREEQILFSSVRCEYQNVIEVLPAEFIQKKYNSLDKRISPSAVEGCTLETGIDRKCKNYHSKACSAPLPIRYFIVYSWIYSITLQLGCKQRFCSSTFRIQQHCILFWCLYNC